MGHFEEDLKALDTKPEGWHEATQKAGRWFGLVEDGAEAYMRKWHDAGRSDVTKRHATAAAAASIATWIDDTNPPRKGRERGREGRGGRGAGGGMRRSAQKTYDWVSPSSS